MSSGLELILIAVTVCVIVLLEHGGPTIAIPISSEIRDTDNSESILVEFCQEHIGLSYRVPCLDCQLLTLICYKIRQEHQPRDGFASNYENPEDSHDFNEASLLLEYADHEDSVANEVPEVGNEESINLLQGNFQSPQSHLQEDDQAVDDLNEQLVPQNEEELLEGVTMNIEEGIHDD